MTYNIYYGTIGTCKYHFTKDCRNEQEAKNIALNAATSYYYKNEGKHGIPSFDQLVKESEITDLDIEQLYKDHINDIMRWYVIPTDKDTISNKDLKY